MISVATLQALVGPADLLEHPSLVAYQMESRALDQVPAWMLVPVSFSCSMVVPFVEMVISPAHACIIHFLFVLMIISQLFLLLPKDIGAQSCGSARACSGVGADYISDNSCNAQDACKDSFSSGKTVSENSCNGLSACENIDVSISSGSWYVSIVLSLTVFCSFTLQMKPELKILLFYSVFLLVIATTVAPVSQQIL